MGVIFAILICVLHALICSIALGLTGLLVDIRAFKHWIFFFYAGVLSAFIAYFHEGSFGDLVGMFFLDILGIYVGLIVLFGLRNMATKVGLCKICDKFRRRYEKFDDN